MVLDRSRPYAEVHGMHGARYEQDGRLFDSRGEEITEGGEPPDGNTEAPPVRRGRKRPVTTQ